MHPGGIYEPRLGKPSGDRGSVGKGKISLFKFRSTGFCARLTATRLGGTCAHGWRLYSQSFIKGGDTWGCNTVLSQVALLGGADTDDRSSKDIG
jgi:hypothetical protein